jgi:hypothetical protein
MINPLTYLWSVQEVKMGWACRSGEGSNKVLYGENSCNAATRITGEMRGY